MNPPPPEPPSYELHQGDSAEILRTLPDESIDALISDPPAGIHVLGHDWDSDKGGRDQWIGWLTEILEECRRTLKPGAHVLLWAISRTSSWTARALEDAGFEIRDVISHVFQTGLPKSLNVAKAMDKIGIDPEDAEPWKGWGTGLRPASECWILARKPLETTVARNVLKHGTGALNIDASRVNGRYPSNFILSVDQDQDYARHFFCAKPSRKERDAGCEDLPLQRAGWTSVFPERKTAYHNTHPTVKPIALMRYLCRMITPPGGTVLDCFAGSGTTGVAALQEGFRFVGIEREEEYVEIARARLTRTDLEKNAGFRSRTQGDTSDPPIKYLDDRVECLGPT